MCVGLSKPRSNTGARHRSVDGCRSRVCPAASRPPPERPTASSRRRSQGCDQSERRIRVRKAPESRAPEFLAFPGFDNGFCGCNLHFSALSEAAPSGAAGVFRRSRQGVISGCAVAVTGIARRRSLSARCTCISASAKNRNRIDRRIDRQMSRDRMGPREIIPPMPLFGGLFPANHSNDLSKTFTQRDNRSCQPLFKSNRTLLMHHPNALIGRSVQVHAHFAGQPLASISRNAMVNSAGFSMCGLCPVSANTTSSYVPPAAA
jgi:hypothetical protein